MSEKKLIVSLIVFISIFLTPASYAITKKDAFHKISFHNASKVQIEMIKNYYGNRYPSETYEDLSVSEYDLNDDKRNELFVYYINSINCGTKGCATDIFILDKNKQMKRVFFNDTYGEIYILDNGAGEFKDIEVTGGTQHVKEIRNLFKWSKASQIYKYQN